MRWFRALLLSLVTAVILGVIWFSYKDYAAKAHSEVESYTETMKLLEEEGMPELSLVKLNGESLSLNNLTANLSIVHFWASWCAPCIEEFPSLVRLANDHPKLQLITISLDESTEEYFSFLSSLKISETDNFHLYRAENIEKISELMGVDKLPESYIFNSENKLVRKIPNAENWDRQDVRMFINHFLKSE